MYDLFNIKKIMQYEWQDFKIKKWNLFIVQMEKLSEQSKTGLRLLYVSFNKINSWPYYKTVLVDHAIVQYTVIQLCDSMWSFIIWSGNKSAHVVFFGGGFINVMPLEIQ